MTSTISGLGARVAGGRPGAIPRGAEMRLPAFEPGRLHELHAAGDDRGAALAFALSMACRDSAGTILLVRGGREGRRGRGGGAPPLVLNGEGLALLGIDLARLMIVEAGPDSDRGLELLRAGLEAARCPGVAAVLIESLGRFAAYDLTASRRLALAAERTGGRVIVLRGDAEPRPSAAQTRWAVGSAPSAAWEARAPGWPALAVELLRWRGGPAGRRWRLEWDAHHGHFRDATDSETLSGAVVPLVAVRADAPRLPPRAA